MSGNCRGRYDLPSPPATLFRRCLTGGGILSFITTVNAMPARILIVDDDPDHCDLIARTLHRIGLETVSAANGWEALIALDTADFDLVLLDLMMPGMDGGTFLNILRNDQRRKHIPVLVVSAVRSDQAKQRVGRAEIQQYFQKANFQLGELLEAVKANIHSDGARPSN
jgi:CheY-like chemotaxis protein